MLVQCTNLKTVWKRNVLVAAIFLGAKGMLVTMQPSFCAAKINALRPSFHNIMSGKSQTIGDFTVSRPSQILLTNENHKS